MSEDTSWYTPPWLVALVRDVCHISLDPCTDETNPVHAPTFCTPAGMYGGFGEHWRRTSDEDGLAFDWLEAGVGIAFVNPPYSRQDSPRWAAKIAVEALRGVEIVALLPARVDTAWWHESVAKRSDVTCFLRGRPRHNRPGQEAAGPGKFPSAVVYFGDRAKVFARAFGPHGWIVETRRSVASLSKGAQTHVVTETAPPEPDCGNPAPALQVGAGVSEDAR